jgi:hypothetical protein
MQTGSQSCYRVAAPALVSARCRSVVRSGEVRVGARLGRSVVHSVELPGQLERPRALSTCSVVASSAIRGNITSRRWRCAPSWGPVTASVTIVSSKQRPGSPMIVGIPASIAPD